MGRTLVLCIDRDNDLGRKIKISGPIIGRAANLDAATKLLIKDPEETDANAIFKAIKVYDSIPKRSDPQIVTLTGDERLGYQADKQITAQLERVLQEYPADGCIVITDGADDDEVLPIISSRIKIDSKQTVIMKQAKELEKTYIVLLNKLKEPYYARMIFGIPAILLLTYLVSESLGFGFKPIIGLVGLYLLIKGFGVEESIISGIKSIFTPSSGTALIVYLPVLALAVIALTLGVTEYTERSAQGSSILETMAFALRPMLWPFLMIILVLLFIGKTIELYSENKKFKMIDSSLYTANSLLVTFVGFMATSWIIGNVWFYEFLSATFASLIIAVVAIELARAIKTRVALRMKLEGKEVTNEHGAYIGKIIGIDRRNSLAIAQTPVGNKIMLKLEMISNIGEKIIIRQE